jgi:hypothetical protein
MLLNNGQTANPLNKYAKAIAAISRKQKKTDEEIEKLARIEFEAGWYLGAGGGYVIPAHNLESCMVNGAKKNKNGKAVSAGSFVIADAPLVFEGSDKSIEELWGGGVHALMCTVGISRRRVLRTRPMVPAGWTAEITVRHDPELVDADVIRQSLEVAGREKGHGDWIPKYGRFKVDQL